VFTRRRDVKPLPLSSLPNIAAYSDPAWTGCFDDLGTYSFDDHIFKSRIPPLIHRKGWEWTQTVYGLRRLGMIRPEHRAVGIGAGRECVIFLLGDHLARVVATDLYGNEKWTTSPGSEASTAVVENPQAFCPRPINLDVIEFQNLDGTNLSTLDDESFDIAWSLSSIEHFGSHERAGDSVREMARVVRPGGVVVIATEYLLLSEHQHPEFFTREELETHVIHASPSLELIEPIDWGLPPPEYLIDSIVAWNFIDRVSRHVILNDGTFQWTSILFFFRKRQRR
jgi:SAM-dependent methyltransferase